MTKIIEWLKAHEPVFCATCARLIFHKDARYEVAQTGAVLPLCKGCHKNFFHPFSEEA